jgi:hypothetical protein
MRDLTSLRHDARRAYERGRLTAASYVAVPIVALIALSVFETRAIGQTLAVGGMLFALAVWLRWRQRNGFAVVSAGLRAGIVPLAAALGLCRFAPACPPEAAFILCGSAGLLAGTWAGRTVTPMLVLWHQHAAAAAVAGLTAALGCLAFGIGIALGAAVAVSLGVAVSARVPRRVGA